MEKAPDPDWELPSNLIRLTSPGVRPEISWVLSKLENFDIHSILAESSSYASFFKSKLLIKRAFSLHVLLAMKVSPGVENLGSNLMDTLNFKYQKEQLNPDLLLELQPIERFNDEVKN